MNKRMKKAFLSKEPTIISLVYFFIGSAWIYFSDAAIGLFKTNPQVYTGLQTYKGIGYVLVTTVLFFIVLSRLVGRLRNQQVSLDKLVDERTVKLEETVMRLKESETEKDRLLENMQRQLQFEQLIFELAQNFFNADPENIHAELDSALQKVRDYSDDDRVCYMKYDWDNERFDLILQQNKNGIPSMRSDWSQFSFKFAQEMVQTHLVENVFSIEDTENSSTEFAAFLREDGVRSFIAIPVVSNGKPRGFIGLYSVSAMKTWMPYVLSVMSIFAQMIKNFYDRSDKEEALRKSHAHMRVILESTRDGICLMDRDGNIILSNNSFSRQYNKQLSDVVGHNILELIPADRYSVIGLVFKKVMETGIPDVYHTVHDDRYYEGSIYPVTGRDGRIEAVASFIADITRRIKNERDIFRTHRMFENLIQHAPVGIYWKDVDGRYLGCNQVAADNLSTTQEELIGQSNMNYMDQDAAQTSSEHDMNIIKSKTACLNYYANMTTKNGKQKIFRINKVPLMDENGEVYALLGVAEDVTEQRQKEMELIQAKQEASAANRAKSDFLSNMSHEIRTPLNAIIGLTHVAAQSGDTLQIKDLLEKVNMSSKHLLSIVNDILDLSRIEAGKMSVSHSETDLIAAIEEVFGIITQRADDKKQHIDLYIDNELPRYVMSDEIRFKQILMNLLFNAVKFTQEGGAIAVRAQILKKYENKVIAKFSVSDNGIGIDENTVERLFYPFEQEDSTSTREYKGAGLGLAICRSVVELMGGEISATGEKGKGSTFSFILPLETAAEKPASLDVAFEDLNVLVVDDDKETCEYMTSLFSQFGIRSNWVDTGKNALEAVKNTNTLYNVVFVDWQMPEMNGIETVKEIRKIAGPDTFVIMFSMFEWGEIEHQAKAAGVSMFLTKPVLPSRLFNTLLQICKQPIIARTQEQTQNAIFTGRHILVAEDIDINQFILGELLKHTGIKITQATDGKQALDLFIESHGAFDAILMDIQMPVMDGTETARQIRNSNVSDAKSVPIIAMTANVFKEDIDRMLMAGMDAHISKPIDPDLLISTLKFYLK